MQLDQWAARWGVSHAALTDLRDGLLGLDYQGLVPCSAMSETAVQAQLRLEAARRGARLWRNNVGALLDDRGIPVRYGLANDSKAVNEVIKSGDLIGIRPIRIEAHHVGHTVGQFVSREAKEGSWKFSGTPREVAQLNWANLINSLGGDARFSSTPDPFFG